MIGRELAHDRITAQRLRGMGTTLRVLFGAILILSTGAPADQLVLRDGQTIETRGAVRLDSRRAIYTDLSGRLVSLRIAEVDVARTLAPSERPVAAAPQTPSRPKSPVLRLTDADVGHVADAARAADTAGATGAEEVAATPVVTLYSTSWCGWCRKSRQLMQALGIAFVKKDVERDPRAAAEKARLAGAQAGVPVLVRDGEVVRGYDEATLRSWAPAQKPGES